MVTFPLHSGPKALAESTVLALIAVVLVNGTVLVSSTRVDETPSNRPLEEALATLARHLSVVLPRTLVSADNTLYARWCNCGSRLFVHFRPAGESWNGSSGSIPFEAHESLRGDRRPAGYIVGLLKARGTIG